MTARGADPRTLFRGGGRTIADIVARIDVPSWVPVSMRERYRLDAWAHGHIDAARVARAVLRGPSVHFRTGGFPKKPENDRLSCGGAP